MRNLIDITDLTIQEIDELIATACDIIANPDKYCDDSITLPTPAWTAAS